MPSLKPGPLHQNQLENLADPSTCAMERWENYSFNNECELVVQDEKIEHVRKVRREQTSRRRARKRAKKGA
jgi:hypothetical protein